LSQQPNIFSCMTASLITGRLAAVIGRLPEDPDGLPPLASAAQAEREQFIRSIHADPDRILQTFELMIAGPAEPLPKWLDHLLLPVYRQAVWPVALCNASLYEADLTEIAARPGTLAVPDLGEQQMQASAERYSPLFIGPYDRLWLRINSALLLREQAEMIRLARTQIASGKSGNLSIQPSVVIPGSKWQLTGDAAAGTISLKLTPYPKWTDDITTASYWLLPLDGSKSWQVNNTTPAVASRD